MSRGPGGDLFDALMGKQKAPPKFKPTLTFRISCDRSKAIHEFKIDIPVSGSDEAVQAAVNEKIIVVLKKLGLI